MLRRSVVFLALFVYVQGRAVNISNTWVLPEEGFPVFYRYFRDRISWYEADAVCQFHHANLVTVDTTAQYDAVRAYLKELDITSAVWVGLIRSNPDGDFTWTDYRGLSGDGYWSSAPDARTAPLCAAANPSADYRWEARACGGPTVASFICELPVPQWALGNEGCMIRALPALTILYLPESAAVQLTADCGLAGVKRVQCTGNVKREDLLKELSCTEEEEVSSTPGVAGLTTTWVSTTDRFTDEDATKDITTEDSITTEHEDDINQSTIVSATPIPEIVNIEKKPNTYFLNTNIVNDMNLKKNVDIDVIHDNNLQSNMVPEIPIKVNFLTNEQLEKIEDEKHMQHKMLHEEIARLGNLDKIFTQPTDHFVPPLVMAKAKLSDDMTVLSLAEKHAQQLAVQQFTKHNLRNKNVDYSIANGNDLTTLKPVNKVIDVITHTDLKTRIDEKKENIKHTVPKKYNEKFDDPKTKLLKAPEIKLYDFRKTTVIIPVQTELTVKDVYFKTSTARPIIQEAVADSDEDHMIDLTVFLKDEPTVAPKQIINTNYSGDISNLEIMQDLPTEITNQTENNFRTVNTTLTIINEGVAQDFNSSQKVIMNHEIVNITIISENDSTVNPTVLEVSTMMPYFLDVFRNSSSSPDLSLNNTTSNEVHSTTNMDITPLANVTQPQIDSTTINTNIMISSEIPPTISKQNEMTDKFPFEGDFNLSTSSTTSTISIITEKTSNTTTIFGIPEEPFDIPNEFHEDDNLNSTETKINDFQSPLLSAASEPIHRPNRSRRPQQQNRIKFNPFRILG
ncbi:uncharacterized protein LOC114252065 [Bombyx mandarina]|uniref:Uncharacterized protein LOC114252065 n=1 Tax=Bombyx mandarina TaxID=7092 RepID=A0A6J2KJS6_BOMMA|nr:uncharacterized protein LOC114252065 [Bombyx mandarina]